MVNVVVAGGTGVVGLHIVQAIRATLRHNVIVFSRSDNPTLAAAGIRVRIVDYSNHDQLVRALQGIHTVISTMSGPDDQWMVSQSHLLIAALEAGVRRFAPSEFGGLSGYMAHKENFASELAWINSPTPTIETTLFQCGFISNAFAFPYQRRKFVNPYYHSSSESPKSSESSSPNSSPPIPDRGLRPFIDFHNLEAYLPPSTTIVVTQLEDLARFVASSLDIPDGGWPEISGIVGTRVEIRDIVKLGEEIRGHPFTVHYSPPTITAPQTRALLQAFQAGLFDIPPVLNRFFPQVQPTPLGDFLTWVWKGKPLPVLQPGLHGSANSGSRAKDSFSRPRDAFSRPGYPVPRPIQPREEPHHNHNQEVRFTSQLFR